MAARLTRLGARALYATRAIDRAYYRGDRLRSLLVLAFGSDALLDEYSRVAYDRESQYNASSSQFRTGLFEWEAEAVSRFFPHPPATILVGGAGGGREPYALVEKGYRVVAFDNARALVASMQARARQDYPDALTAYCGRYEQLPMLEGPGGTLSVDVRDQGPFDAAILGWGSFSHLLTDADRVSALTWFGQLTAGPILVSYFTDLATDPAALTAGSGPIASLRRRARRRGAAVFTPGTGYVQLLSHEDIDRIARRAGLEVLYLDKAKMWPHAVLRRADRSA